MKILRTAILVAIFVITSSTGALAVDDETFENWQSDWAKWQAIATAQGWTVTPLDIRAPARTDSIETLATIAGVPVPHQLHDLLATRSAGVVFGWHQPGHLQSMHSENMPFGSGSRDVLWDIDHIRDVAIPNFEGWRDAYASETNSEAPNTPEMWENQFPLSELINGDIITIDVSDPHRQPVRYFSHELEGWHGTEIAPDLFTYITVRSALGWAGTEQDSMFLFTDDPGSTYDGPNVKHLQSDNAGARAWIAWATRDPALRHPDDPAPSIVVETNAELALMIAARDDNTAALRSALLAGARPDVTPNSDMRLNNLEWGHDYATPLILALRRGDLEMVQVLLDAGATLDTRRPALVEAADTGSLDTMKWLIDKGARPTGWRHARYHPVHVLMNRYAFYAGETRDSFVQRQQAHAMDYESMGLDATSAAQLRAIDQDRLKAQLRRFIDVADTAAMLETLLAAGADPNAQADNGGTLLMSAKAPIAQILLTYGADPMQRNIHGETAFHRVSDPDVIPLLITHGGDMNATATPPESDDRFPKATPLQNAMLLESFSESAPAVIDALLAAGADPTKPDGDGRPTIAYAAKLHRFDALLDLGLDPLAIGPEDSTVVHAMADHLAAPSQDRLAILDRLLAIGVNINAVDARGQTVLHRVAQMEWATREAIDALLTRGADPMLRDANGARPVDLVGDRAFQDDVRSRLSAN